jgi:UTP--glucose-1-phosphate uridylyltransferase
VSREDANEDCFLKVVVAAGGFGTRLQPATRAIPKCMLPVANRPMIQHVVEELLSAGATDMAILHRSEQSSILSHLTPAPARLTSILCDGVPELGESILLCRDFIEQQPFLLALADEFGHPSTGNVSQALMATFRASQCSTGTCLGTGAPHFVSEARWLEVHAAVGRHLTRPQDLTNCLQLPEGMLIGRYLLTPEFLEGLEFSRRKHGSASIYDAFQWLASRQRLMTMPFPGAWWHCNTPVHYLRACLDHVRMDPTLADDLKKYFAADGGSL